jgi:hypothetical protein
MGDAEEITGLWSNISSYVYSLANVDHSNLQCTCLTRFTHDDIGCLCSTKCVEYAEITNEMATLLHWRDDGVLS